MTPEQFERARELFEQALALPSSRQEAFLAERCAGDAELLAVVRNLLERAHAQAGQPAANSATPSPGLVGSQIGPYRVRSVLGEGGMGTVYEAEHERSHQVVALKLIRPGLATPSLLRRFEIELQTLARLEHAGIARIYHADTANTGSGPQSYFAMELVRGQNLLEYANEHKLTIRQRLELAARIADAVQYAHQQGVIHRDLKPGNIFVTAEGQPKILDFGVARATDSDVQSTTLQAEIGQLIGTLPYMSPEQASGDPNQIDTRSDVYALGVVIYELLTGRLPYLLQQRMIHDVLRIIREEEPTRLSSLNRTLRGDVETIVGKALEKDKDRRYASANSLAADIRRYLVDEPIGARPPSATYQLAKFARRNKILVGGVAATIVALTAGLATSIVLYRRAEGQAERAKAAEMRERDERTRAETALAEVTKSRDETQQVADFQSRMLSDIDVEAMGIGLKRRFREQVRAALIRQYVGEYPNRHKRTPEEIDVELAAYDERAGAAQGTDVARRVMDEYVLKRAADALTKQFDNQPLVQAQIRSAIGETYYALGLYSPAEPLYREALAMQRKLLGDEHPRVASSLNNLAGLLKSKSDYAAAEPLFREALTMRRKLLGDEHPDVASSLNNLANLLQAKADYAGAEPLFREALTMRRKLLGDEHADVALSLNNLAGLLQLKGDYAAAEPLYREAMAMQRKLLGDEHLNVALSLSNLAVLLQDKGDYATAEPLYREALAVRRKRLGDEHPLVARSLNYLANLLKTKGDYAAAEPLYREALAMQRKLLGDEHLAVATSLNNLANLLRAKGDYAVAEPLYREALAVRRKQLGDEHPDVATSLNNLANLLRAKGDFAAAEPLYRDALAMDCKLLGNEHLRVALSLNNLAGLLQDKADYAGAELLFREALAMYRKLLGDEHPYVAATMNNLAVLLQDKGDYAAAEPLFRESLAMQRKLMGDEHPDVATNLNNLSRLLQEKGDYAAAEPLHREALAMRRKLLGDEHVDTHLSRIGLGLVLAKLGQFSEARSLLAEANERLRSSANVPARLRQGLYGGFVEMYHAWHAAEPGQGHDTKAAEWRAKLVEWQASTQPAAQSAPVPTTSAP